MSFDYYTKWWAATKENLRRLTEDDKAFVDMTNKGVKSRNLANTLVGGLYAKYCMIIQDLGTILDQMAQPQKRITVRKLMDAATVRLNELNEELRTIDISEYHYIDGALIELKLIPQDIEILDPILYYLRDYTVEDLWKKIQNGEKIYTPPPPPEPEVNKEDPEHPQEKAEGDETKPEGDAAKTEKEDVKQRRKSSVADEHKLAEKKIGPGTKELSQEEKDELLRKQKITSVVNLIQNNERGRQARLYFVEKYDDFLYKKKIRDGFKPPTIDPKLQEKSAIQIQSVWRGHCSRQYIRRKEKERRFLIGMYEPSWKSYEEFEILERNLQKRREIRDQRIKEYVEANLAEKTRVYRVIAPGLMEDIGDEIREWFHYWYDEVKNFDVFPPEDKGGTVLVVRGETLTPKQWIDKMNQKKNDKAKDKGKDKAKLKAEKAKKKKEAAAKKKKEKDIIKKELLRKKKKRLKPWDFELEYEPTAAQEPFAEAFKEYQRLYHEKKDEDNPEELHYHDMIHEEQCYELQLELRKIVDQMMRAELEILEEALMKDRGKKVKKKKPKKAKKGKGKKNKDPTADRTLEDLFQELVDNGIIHTYDKAYLKDYRGDFSYANWDLRMKEYDPPANLGDVRQAVKINCIAPLSTACMKKPKSVLLTGPRQCGKHLLANAVFTESQSVLFDISAPILVGKYPGGKGMKMLLHLINKMSRLLQPSVIYLEGAEKAFYKKVPKEEKHLDPKRMGGKLFKGIVKTIKPEDRVLVFGISSQPWLGKPAQMKKAFERVILMPRPDYGTIYLYWRELLMPYHGIDRNIDLSSLTALTKYFPLPDLKRAVENVLTPRRIIQLSYNPLRQSELLEFLIDVIPITEKEYKKFETFYSKNPLAKERRLLNTFNEAKREAESKNKKNKK